MKENISSHSKKIGLPPGTIVYTGHKKDRQLFIDVFDYNKDFLEEKELKNVAEAFSFENENSITWINVNGLNHVQQIEELGLHYELHPLIIEDIASTKQRPKVDEYEDYLFIVLKMLYFDEGQNLKIEHISFVLGPNYVLSFQETEGDVFEPVRERLRAGKGRARGLGSDYLLYILMDAIVDNYFALIETFGDKIEVLEDKLFDNKTDENITSEIQVLKKEILKIRRAVYPLREVINKLEKAENVLINEKTHNYLRDLYDHIIQVSESIDIYREMIWGLMDMYMSTISNKMNEVMKVLTIMASIFIPLTFLAGIYGMNFENIPELKFEYGYFVLLGIMVLVFVGMIYYFRKRRWL